MRVPVSDESVRGDPSALALRHVTIPIAFLATRYFVTEGIEPKPSKSEAKSHVAQLCCDALGYRVSPVCSLPRLTVHQCVWSHAFYTSVAQH